MQRGQCEHVVSLWQCVCNISDKLRQ